jgi:hypothetical protein
MKHIHTFESFLFERLISESEEKLGRITVKSEEDLKKLYHTDDWNDTVKSVMAYRREEQEKAAKAETPETKKEHSENFARADAYLTRIQQVSLAMMKREKGDPAAATEALVKYLAGAIGDEGMTKTQASEWLSGKEGTTAAKGALEAGADDFGNVKWSKIKKDVISKIMSMKDIFAEEE